MRTVNQTREQRLTQLTTQRDHLQERALSYVELAEVILRTPASKQVYGRHWRAVARVLKEDAVRLTQKATDIEGRIADLERARDAAENWTPPELPDLVVEITADTTAFERGVQDLFADDEDNDGEPWGDV